MSKKREAIEALVKAKSEVRSGHSDRCMVEMDPEYMGPCTSGCPGGSGSEVKRLIDKALDALLSD